MLDTRDDGAVWVGPGANATRLRPFAPSGLSRKEVEPRKKTGGKTPRPQHRLFITPEQGGRTPRYRTPRWHVRGASWIPTNPFRYDSKRERTGSMPTSP